MRSRWLVGLILLMQVLGCATLVRGTRQTVRFDTSPEGAEVRDKRTDEVWIAPADISFLRRQRHSLLVSKDGYEPQEVYLRSEVPFEWWFVGSLTLGVSLAFDATLGGLYDLEPKRIAVVLERSPGPLPQ
jgi:hypothetical protein